MQMAICLLEGRTGHDAGRALLEALYTAHTNAPLPPILLTDRGKPYFKDGLLHFSISHTEKRAVCVLSERPVGVDAEEADRKIDLRLAEKILSPGEYAQYQQAEDKRLALLTFWVLKEAYLKCTGEGLRRYPNHTDFALTDNRVTLRDGCLIAVIEGAENLPWDTKPISG